MSDFGSDTCAPWCSPSPAGSILAFVSRHGTASVIPLERPADPVDASPAAPLELAELELPRARRPGWPTLAALAIASGLVALGLGAWAIVSGAEPEPKTSLEGPRLDRALAILADSASERVPLRGSLGRIVLVAAADDRAVLALDGLGAAPGGHEYEAWVVPPGSATPLPAGTFDGSDRVVLLTRPAPPGARVGVTLEEAGGVERPTRSLRLVAERAS